MLWRTVECFFSMYHGKSANKFGRIFAVTVMSAHTSLLYAVDPALQIRRIVLASDILELPLDDSRLLYSYATVPFMSMVLHGYKEYSGTALNLAGDYNYHLLKTIESGASPYFIIAANNTSELKQHTDFALSKYYSVRYNIWVDDIVSAYNSVNEALSDVQNSAIRKHEILSDDGKVAKVVYENGISFYVNYGEKAYNIDELDTDIPVGGYVKVDAEGKVIKVWEDVE